MRKLKNKKVLVTGADGFIGSHLVETLVDAGAHVRALACYNSFNRWGWLDTLDCVNDIEVITGDIRDPFFCRDMVKGADTVFHLAALIAIPFSYTAPASYVETNVQGTLNVCQAVKDEGCARLVHTSTSEVYGTALYVPIDEKHPIQPQSPYSASKVGADAVAYSFFRSFELPVTIARPFNTYGPRQSARAILPTIIGQLASGVRAVRIGDVRPTRDFTYVKDTSRALVALAESEKTIGEVVNIGTNREISILDVFQSIRKRMGVEADYQTDEKRLRPENSEVFRLWCDNRKLQTLTGYTPPHRLEEGLRETIEWFRKGENIRDYKTHLYNV